MCGTRGARLFELKGHSERVEAVAVDEGEGTLYTCSASRVAAWTMEGELLVRPYPYAPTRGPVLT
eukprot:2495510-Rhodomonas_salina.2